MTAPFSLSDKRFNTLPVWARNELTRLRGNERYYKQQLTAAIGERETPIEVNPGSDMSDAPRKFLDESSRVRFDVGKRAFIDVSLSPEGDGVEVYAALGGTLKVLPRSSNVVRLVVEDH